MPVLQSHANALIDHKELYQFLLAGQQNCLRTNCTQILSISVKISQVDPLVLLEKLAKPDQLNFYFENKEKGVAIAAIDAVAKLEIEGQERFETAQNFIDSCLKNTLTLGDINSPFTGPHFFCSFKFFAEKNPIKYPFPAATVFLPRWHIARRNSDYVLVANMVLNADININSIFHNLQQDVQALNLAENNANKDERGEQKFIKEDVNATENYKRAVCSSLESIRQKHLRKIVIAHALNVKSDMDFSLFQSLNNLRKIHPNCYIFSTSNGRGQNFIGASPERLISIHQQRLMTDALAGSAPRGRTAYEDADLSNILLNSEKERREHRVVMDFITQRLCQLGIVPTLLTPRLRQLSNIQHLWTPIRAQVPDNVHPLEIVAALHPTPAVAGVGREIACEEIRRYETFERGLYAAPLGWVDHQGNSEFIVGIRSALIDGDRARLYAGAGIVAGSDPDKELAEIQLKLQALLKALV